MKQLSNMKTKPFDLERALAGDKMVMVNSNGHASDVVHIKKIGESTRPFLIVLMDKGGRNIQTLWADYEGKVFDRNLQEFKIEMVDEEPLKIEAGKLYKTRNGEKAYNFNLPTTAGTAGQVLTSQGGGSTAMTWSSVMPATTTVYIKNATGGYVYVIKNRVPNFTCDSVGFFFEEGNLCNDDLIEEWKD